MAIAVLNESKQVTYDTHGRIIGAGNGQARISVVDKEGNTKTIPTVTETNHVIEEMIIPITPYPTNKRVVSFNNSKEIAVDDVTGIAAQDVVKIAPVAGEAKPSELGGGTWDITEIPDYTYYGLIEEVGPGIVSFRLPILNAKIYPGFEVSKSNKSGVYRVNVEVKEPDFEDGDKIIIDVVEGDVRLMRNRAVAHVRVSFNDRVLQFSRNFYNMEMKVNDIYENTTRALTVNPYDTQVYTAKLLSFLAEYDQDIAKPKITYTDPNEPKWAATMIRRKMSGYPQGIQDGYLVSETEEKNKYSVAPLVDDFQVEDGDTVYYTAFPKNSKNVYNLLLPDENLFKLIVANVINQDIETGIGHTVELTTTGEVYTEGDNDYGQLGQGISDATGTSTLINGIGELGASEKVKKIKAMDYSTMLMTEASLVYVFGRNDRGQLGIASTSNVPVENTEFTGVARTIAAGANTGYVVKTDGTVWSFGANDMGQAGISGGSDITVPTQIAGDLTGVNILKIAADANHAVALDDQGYVYTWGENVYQLEIESSVPTYIEEPVKLQADLSGVDVLDISADTNSILALSRERDAYAWTN